MTSFVLPASAGTLWHGRSRLWLALSAFALGCASAPPTEATTTPATTASVDPKPETACARFGERMCESLGEKTHACEAVTEVLSYLSSNACLAALADVDTSLARVEAMRKRCAEVADKLCARVGSESAVCKKIRTDMQVTVPPGSCPRLQAAYPELEAQLLAQLERDKPLDQAQQQALLVGEPPAFGPADAKVTLVEFSDFQCPYCAMAAEAVKQIKNAYGDRVRFVFRQFPLSFHENAQAAAEAAMAAHAQGKFWELHDMMFNNQQKLSAKDLRGYAQQIGLDLTKYDEAVSGNTYADAVKGDMTLGEQVFVRGTPTLFINGKRAENPTEFEAIKPLIEEAMAATP